MAASFRTTAVVALAYAGFFVAACGLSTTGTGVDLLDDVADSAVSAADATTGSEDGTVATTHDASSDASAPTDADASDAGATSDASGGLDAGMKTDAGATDAGTGFKYVCPSTGATVTSCASCATHPVACVLCGAGGARQTFCTTAGAACINSAQAGFNWCACSGQDASACPLDLQECYSDGTYNNICITCGENKSSGYKCKAGGSCTEATGLCN